MVVEQLLKDNATQVRWAKCPPDDTWSQLMTHVGDMFNFTKQDVKVSDNIKKWISGGYPELLGEGMPADP